MQTKQTVLMGRKVADLKECIRLIFWIPIIQLLADIQDPLSEALLCFGASSVSMDEYEEYENSDEVFGCETLLNDMNTLF